MQLCSSSVTSLPPFRAYLRSARIASSRPVILRRTTRRWVAPSGSVYPIGSVSSNSRCATMPLLDMFQPLVLEDDRLLQQRGRSGFQVCELRRLDPGVLERERHHLLAVVALLDHSVLADSRAALDLRVEIEHRAEPVLEALVLRAAVDIALDRQRLELHLRGRDLVDVVAAAVRLLDRLDLAFGQAAHLADPGTLGPVGDQNELVGPVGLPDVADLRHCVATPFPLLVFRTRPRWLRRAAARRRSGSSLPAWRGRSRPRA